MLCEFIRLKRSAEFRGTRCYVARDANRKGPLFRLCSNGSCYIPKDLAAYLREHGLGHTRGRPYHPMTQGKIERYHRSMKNVVRLENYYTPWELERAIARFVDFYNHERLHEALGNVTPDDMYHGRQRAILTQREKIKRLTLERRRKENLRNAA